MRSNYRKNLIKVVTFLGGIYFLIEFILPEAVLKALKIADLNDQISYGFIAISAMAIGLGLINLVYSHGARIIFVKRGWINSAALLLGMVGMMYLTYANWMEDLKNTNEISEFSNLSTFATIIKKDFENNKTDVLPVHLRNQKLSTAVKEEIAKMDLRSDKSLNSDVQIS